MACVSAVGTPPQPVVAHSNTFDCSAQYTRAGSAATPLFIPPWLGTSTVAAPPSQPARGQVTRSLPSSDQNTRLPATAKPPDVLAELPIVRGLLLQTAGLTEHARVPVLSVVKKTSVPLTARERIPP